MPDIKFAAKTTSFAPLTATADSFSAHDKARPDFKQGRVVVADYQFPQSIRLEGLKPSYTRSGQQQPEGEES
jgi:hypothetical protein